MYINDFNFINIKTNDIKTRCSSEYMNNLKNEIIKNKRSIVVLGAWYSGYINAVREKVTITQNKTKYKLVHIKNNKSIIKGFEVSIQNLLDNNIKIILVYPTPVMIFMTRQKILNKLIMKRIMFSTNATILSMD